MKFTETDILQWLQEVRDPEIPVLNVIEMGIIRNVRVDGDCAEIDITPTYSGCPAMRVIEEDITAKLNAEGIANVKVKRVLAPAWTTDWMSAAGKEKMKRYGIAPPLHHLSKIDLLAEDNRAIACPRCDSQDSELRSLFGSTACKALYFCNACREPFEYFKCL